MVNKHGLRHKSNGKLDIVYTLATTAIMDDSLPSNGCNITENIHAVFHVLFYPFPGGFKVLFTDIVGFSMEHENEGILQMNIKYT